MRLNGDVEGRDSLVANNQFGLEGEGPGNGDALALAAGELVWIAARMIGVEPDLLQQIGDPIGPKPFLQYVTMYRPGLTDDCRHVHAGIERAVWILKYDLDLAAKRQQVGAVQSENIAATVNHRAVGRVLEPQDRAA